MNLRSALFLLLGLLTFPDCCLAADPHAPLSASPRRVVTLVAPYAIAKSQKRLEKIFGGKAGPQDGLSHLALQFWTPSPTGGLDRIAEFGEISDEKIQEFVTWAHEHGIQVMLCVYNGGTQWDWLLAKNAFATNRDTFVSALVAEMDRLSLDGVDIDFEGSEAELPTYDFNADRASFVQFVSALSTQIHSRNKQVTVDSFPYIYNAPNQSWWSDLFPVVDALNSMGYQDTGRKAAEWASYSAQKTAAGENAAKLMIGLPSDLASWSGSSAAAQLNWFLADGEVGVTIWDAQLPSIAWRTALLWKRLQKIREGIPPLNKSTESFRRQRRTN